MPCPYFLPDKPLPRSGWFQPRVPLGRMFEGRCCADPDAPAPTPDATAEACNSGYARGRCGRFPASAPHDALRFALPLNGPWGPEVQWIAERDCFPVAHGWVDSNEDSIRGAQARAFLSSFSADIEPQ